MTERFESQLQALRARLAELERVIERPPEKSEAYIKQELQRRADLLARRPEPEADAGQLVVELVRAGQIYILGMSAVLKVDRLVDFTLVPGAPSHVPGVCNLHGNILSVVDLAPLLMGREVGVTPEWVVVMGHERAELGLVADRIEDLRVADPSILQEPVDANRDPVVRGLTTDGRMWLSPEALLRDTRLFVMTDDRNSRSI